MPAGARLSLRMNSSSIRKHSARLSRCGSRILRSMLLKRPTNSSISFDAEDHEIVEVDLARWRPADAGGDQLDRALKELRRAFDADVVAVLEAAIILLAGVPHAGADRAAAVGQFDLQIEIAVAVGAQLLFGRQEDLIDGFLVSQLADVATRHRELSKYAETWRSERRNCLEEPSRILGRVAKCYKGRAVAPGLPAGFEASQ